jgi:hypothetical protein
MQRALIHGRAAARKLSGASSGRPVADELVGRTRDAADSWPPVAHVWARSTAQRQARLAGWPDAARPAKPEPGGPGRGESGAIC